VVNIAQYYSVRWRILGAPITALERHPMSNHADQSSWKDLAEQASKKTDPKRLLSLVTELNQVLENSEHQAQEHRRGLTSKE
jgi:hypothetical protein